MYTRVLLGVIDLERVHWPEKNKYTGGDFDILARRHIFEAGLDYRHGTGHGVGYFLFCHEGPIGVSRGYKKPWQVGMCVSDEPGYYKDGEFGIRIENVIMVVNSSKPDFQTFENLTLCPYERRLIDLELLSPKDRKFLNEFHVNCKA